METEVSIFDKIKKTMEKRYGWIVKAWKSKAKVSPSGDVYIRSKDVFKGQKDEAIKTLEKISSLITFKL